ncbi:holo-[acyl-carrier protein] synthase [Pilibacter termitis]|uniref:Holo-[acyl-carrier protein] synthase n=2 Tax=Pilibacter termitis TaxID=263852 RepID=A0A1T4P8E5_9ENTE|nr:holo-[acyl-carrier protein] synthase [Pilibacter termitis]
MEEIPRIQKILERKPQFAARILTARELEKFHSYTGRRQAEFLAGRYTAKEAFSKAFGTGIGKISFQDIEVLNDEYGVPQITKSPYTKGEQQVSITHTKHNASAVVILM